MIEPYIILFRRCWRTRRKEKMVHFKTDENYDVVVKTLYCNGCDQMHLIGRLKK